MDLHVLCETAIEAALKAGKHIQQFAGENLQIEHKYSGSSRATQVVTQVDYECEQIIVNQLLPSIKTYELALLTEETEDDESRFKKDFFWCVDPLDGTLPFTQNKAGYSVSIALVAQDGTPHLGVIFDPSTHTLYHAIKNHGAFRNGKPWEIHRQRPYLSYFTDKKLSSTPNASEIRAYLQQQAQRLGLVEWKELSGAGAVMNAMYVLENAPACMIKHPKKEEGGGAIWDYAASLCIYQELGLKAGTFEGQKLHLNRKNGVYMHQEGVFFGSLV
jgi:fructose-1,6-bisphosphatase/inositol monophosphatase family enzyme